MRPPEKGRPGTEIDHRLWNRWIEFCISCRILQGANVRVEVTSSGTVIDAECPETFTMIRVTAKVGDLYTWEPVVRHSGAWAASGPSVPYTVDPAREVMDQVPTLPHVAPAWRSGGELMFIAKPC